MGTDRRDDDSDLRPFASSPCMMPEFEGHAAAQATHAPATWSEISAWRKAERTRQIQRRLALDRDTRTAHAAAIAQHLLLEIGPAAGLTVSLYWPLRGEPDLRSLFEAIAVHGGSCALPVVATRAQPLEFHSWAPGEPLERGHWNIPVPAAGAPVVPDVVIAPVVAFDRHCYRLGYGGGYFDRTLSSAPNSPRVLGVGFGSAEVDSILPQPHDIPMNVIVTERGVRRPPAS